MPSFGTEWLLELREAEEGGALVLREASSSIAAKWAAVSPAFRDVFGFNSTEPFVDKIEVTERVATISDELAAMVVQAWDEQLSSVCLGRSLGNDGTTYDFSARYRADIRSGHTWSPDAATPAGHLVGIAELLKDFVLAPRSEQKQIAEEISGLAMALKVLEPGGGPGLTTP